MKAKIYSGVTVEPFIRNQNHPLTEVKIAKSLIDRGESIKTYSNSTDFISTIKYYGEKKGYECEFFLDGVSYGNDIEPLFQDFNRALDMLNNLI